MFAAIPGMVVRFRCVLMMTGMHFLDWGITA